MQETANDYFNRNLPENVGESYTVTLKEMYSLGLSDKLYNGSTSCDAEKSYISVTKSSDEEYKVKSYLVCGNQSDSKSNVIKVKSNNNTNNPEDTNTTVNTNTSTNTTTNTNTTNTNTNTTKNTTTNTNTNKSSSCSSNKNTSKCGINGITCQIIVHNCDTVYEYEFVKNTYGCPEGYVITSDGRCIKTAILLQKQKTLKKLILHMKQFILNQIQKELLIILVLTVMTKSVLV